MISSKVFLTYKRKRKISHGTGYLKSCSKYSTGETVPGNLVESGETCFQESQNVDAWSCGNCASADAAEIFMRCDSCFETCHLQCLDPLLKLKPRGQWSCSTCVERQDSGAHQVQASRTMKPRITIEESDFGLSGSSCRTVLQTVSAHNETAGSVQRGELPEKKSDNCDMGLSAHTNHVRECKSTSAGESSSLQSINVEAPKKSSSECLGALTEKDCTIEYTSVSKLRPSVSDAAESPFKDNSDLCNCGATLKKKFSIPVITFNRKYRNKKNETNIEIQLVKEKKCSATICSACCPDGSFGDASKQCTSATHQSTSPQVKEDKFVEQNRREDAGLSSSIAARGVHETKMHVEQSQSTQKCLPDDHSPIVALVPCLNSSLHLSSLHPEFQSGVQVPRKECSRKTSTDETDSSVINKKVPESPKLVDLNAEQCDTQNCMSDSVMEAGISNHVSENGDFLAPLDLTASTIDLRCTENFLDSSSPIDPNHVTDWCGKAPKNMRKHPNHVRGLLESADDSVKEKLAFIEEGCNNHHGKDSPMLSLGIPLVGPSKQSCTDDGVSQVVPPSEPLDSTASLDPEEINPTVESGCRMNQKNTKGIESPLFPCSVGLSSPSLPAINFFKETPSIPSLSNSDILSGGCSLEMSLQSETRHRQILDSITAKALRERQDCFLGQLKGDTRIWSEEELDFLWVGVRRHGKGNWVSILRDPRLRFSKFRGAADLAERWDLEQLNLLNSTSQCIDSDFFSRKRLVGSQCNNNYHTEDSMIILSGTLTDETRLSLGDAHVQRQRFEVPSITQMLTNGGISERMSYVGNSKLTHSVLQRIGTKQLQIPSRRQRNRSHSYANYRRQRYAPGPSVHQKPVERSTYEEIGVRRGLFNSRGDDLLLREGMPTGMHVNGKNLPHWLKEVVSMSSLRPFEPALLPNVGAAGSESWNLQCNNYGRCSPSFPDLDASIISPLGPRQRLDEFDLQATSDIPNYHRSSKSKLDLSRVGSGSEIHQSGNLISDYRSGPDFNCPVSYPVTKAHDLIVIDSDASSEETISDDQSGRP